MIQAVVFDCFGVLAESSGKNIELLAYIAELKKRGFKLGILSNITNNWVRDEFLSKEEQGLFDAMVFSYEVGVSKPDPRIFLLAAEQLGVIPEQVLFVDDLARYCDAAEGVGMQAVVYENTTDAISRIDKLLA